MDCVYEYVGVILAAIAAMYPFMYGQGDLAQLAIGNNAATSLFVVFFSISGTAYCVHSLQASIVPLANHWVARLLIFLALGATLSFLSTYLFFFLIRYYTHYPSVSLVATTLYKSYSPALVIALLVNGAGFLLAYLFQTDKLTDLSYGLTFLLVASYSVRFSHRQPKDIILYTMVVLWALRLCAFLLRRILVLGRDTRFDAMRSSFIQFGMFWLLQAISVSIILLPVLLCLQKRHASSLSLWSYLGMLLFAVGLLIETVADHQKFTFMQHQTHPKPWMETGLWRYSRHPNYFGEMLLWIGIYLYVLPYLTPFENVFASIGPLYIIMLLTFVSGIPILEKRAEQRWQGNQAYAAYRRKTSVLVPWCPSKT